MADDALEFIKEDHDDFRELLNRYEEIGVDEHDAKKELIDDLIEKVVAHSAMEEEAFYPFIMEQVPDAEDDIREEIEEHHVVEVIMAELKAMDPKDDQFDAKVEVFAENLLHHLEEEEDELFPMLRQELDATTLEGLKGNLERAKTAAPSEPDPERYGA